MREIKFRVWAHASGVMFYPDAEEGWTMSGGRLRELPNTTLMQYTGLKDKNGKEIYEGDIVLLNRQGKKTPTLVLFNGGMFHAGYHYGSSTTLKRKALQSSLVEIIGNIHENPELLNAD